jgi:hypothetical protein
MCFSTVTAALSLPTLPVLTCWKMDEIVTKVLLPRNHLLRDDISFQRAGNVTMVAARFNRPWKETLVKVVSSSSSVSPNSRLLRQICRHRCELPFFLLFFLMPLNKISVFFRYRALLITAWRGGWLSRHCSNVHAWMDAWLNSRRCKRQLAKTRVIDLG